MFNTSIANCESNIEQLTALLNVEMERKRHFVEAKRVDDEEELGLGWVDISTQSITPARMMRVTITDNDCNPVDYVLEWESDGDKYPHVFIDKPPYNAMQYCKGKTVILKYEGTSTCICIWDNIQDLPESTADCQYEFFHWPGNGNGDGFGSV